MGSLYKEPLLFTQQLAFTNLRRNILKSKNLNCLAKSIQSRCLSTSNQFTNTSSIKRNNLYNRQNLYSVSYSNLQLNHISKRFNSNSPRRHDQNGDRILSDEEAADLLSELKKIWNDSSLSENESRIKLNQLLKEYQIGGMISPSASKMVSTILTDLQATKPGEKMENVQKWHKALMDYHLGKQLDFNGVHDERFNPDPNRKPQETNKESENQSFTSNENKRNDSNEINEDNNNNNNNKNNNDKNNKNKPTEEERKLFVAELNVNLLLMWAGVAILAVYSLMPNSGSNEITWQDFRTSLLDKHLVEKLIVVNDNIVRVVLNDHGKNQPMNNANSEYYFTIGSVQIFEEKLKQAQIDNHTPEEQRVPVLYTRSSSFFKVLYTLLPTILLFGFLAWSTRKMFSGAGGLGGGLFGAGKAKFKKFNAEKDVKIKFDDVAGCDEAKEEIMEFVKFLKNPEKYERLGAKIPRGAILSGPPGTGKTLLAKATAGEAGVPFYSVSGSEFVEMFVGVGASRVRDLFKTARENAPSIIFVDEIDAIGKSRSKGKVNGGNDERENTLNQLLVEMDGFQTSDYVVVLAGTNRADVLDAALLRPGRFDRKVYVDNPELEGRKAIFGVHLRKIKLAKDTDLDDLKGRLATLTPGFSGADIANCCNEAALIAARHEEEAVHLSDFEQAIERVIAGLEKKSKLLSPEEKKIVAFHEAGHAICGWYLEFADPLLKVSIVPRGQGALGYAQYLPADIYLYSTQKLLDRMTMTLGGRVSEEMHFKSVTSGASDDFEKVTNLAQKMVLECGMSEKVGLINYNQDRGNDMSKPFSDKTASLIDSEIHRLVSECYKRCESLLNEKKHEVKLVADRLLEKEVITREDMIELLGKRPFPNRNDAFDKYLENKDNKKSDSDADKKDNEN
ncbi:hypothetical protein B5S31_g1413 [[Candida] boidinii]|nr:hypothetical protein B5S31_g1413 [[Candida] boidinii]